MGAPAYTLGPDQSGRPPRERPREPWSALVKVLNVVRGTPPKQELVGVAFGGGALNHTYALGPRTPHQLAQEYYVAMYQDADGFHLVGVPMSGDRYRDWHREIHEFEREQLKR